MATKNSSIILEKTHFDAFKQQWSMYHQHSYSVETMVNIGVLQVSTAYEHALAEGAGLEVVSEDTHDLSDGSDAKLCTARYHGGIVYPKYGIPVTNIHGKTGDLRVQGLEPQTGEIYRFVFPRSSYEHLSKKSNIEIPFDLNGTPLRSNHWWRYEVQDWDQLCNLTGEQAKELNQLNGVHQHITKNLSSYPQGTLEKIELRIAHIYQAANIRQLVDEPND